MGHEVMWELQKELRGLGGERPITPFELEEAKGLVIHGLPSLFDTLWSAAEEIARLWGNGLPLTEDRTLPDRVAALSLADVNAAARKYARVDKAFFVLLGDRKKIEPRARDLGLGPVVIVQ